MLSKYIQSFTLPLFLLPLIFVYPATASVTVYGYAGAVASSTVSGAQPQYTGMQAYNPVTLQPPPLPVPLPANAFNIAVHKATPNGVSIKLRGSFMGFSIEFSVLNQVCMWIFFSVGAATDPEDSGLQQVPGYCMFMVDGN